MAAVPASAAAAARPVRWVRSPPRARSILALAALLGLASCGPGGPPPGQGGAPGGKPPAMPVTVAAALERTVSEWDEFVGRVEAVERVELRPRVSGVLLRVEYTQGADVAAGAVLFQIDPEPFRTEVARLEAELARTRARFELARGERQRVESLVDSGAVSRQEADERRAAERDTEAAARATEAALSAARLQLQYTTVRAPIAGRSGRAEVTAGNFVTAGQTVLTTLMSSNPVYVTFEADEQAYLRHVRSARRGERPGTGPVRSPVYVGLANEEGYPGRGTVQFLDNRINPQTGTIMARAVLDNRDGRYTPGLYARVRLAAGAPRASVLIDDRAVGTDQNKRFVLVLAPDSSVQYREVRLGPLVDGLRVIRGGLAAGETIVVAGLQRVRPGMPVQPAVVPMDPKERAKEAPQGPAGKASKGPAQGPAGEAGGSQRARTGEPR
jgi:RND family efflux transporter MFP subunit